MNSELMIKIDANIKGFQNQMKAVSDESKNLQGALSSLTKKSAVGMAAFGAAIGVVTNKAADFERIQTQFEVLTGNVVLARIAMKELQEFSASTPFQFEDIAKATTRLMGFGFTAGEATARMQSLGDVASASNSSIGEISLIFGQVSAAGKLTGERLLQLQERAIPIGPALAKTMGVAESSIKQLVSEGKVDFATFEKAFQSLSKEGGYAFDGMKKQSMTFHGVLSTLKDNFALLFNEVGQRFLPIFKSAMLAVIDFIGVIRNNKMLVELIALFLKTGFVLTSLGVALGTAGLALTKLSGVFSIVGIAAKTLGLTMKSALIGSGIGLIIVAIGVLATNWDSVMTFMSNIFDNFVKTIMSLGSGLTNILKGIFTLDIDTFRTGLEEIRQTWRDNADEFKEEKQIREEINLEEQLAKNEEEVAKEKARLKRLSNLKKKAEADDSKSFIAALNKRQEYDKLTGEQKVANFQSTMQTISTMSDSNNKAMMIAGKGAAIANATVSTYQAANQALAAPPGPPWSFAYVAAVIAAGLSNVSKIMGVKLAKGGIVMPRIGGTQATIGEAGDAEAVIPLNKSKLEEYGIGGGGRQEVDINLMLHGNLAQIIEEQQIQNQNLRISIQRA